MSQEYRVGLDISALNPDFKEHALRGIGRYVFELNRFFSSHQTDSIKVASFRHEDFAPRGALHNLIEMAPFGRQTLRQQILFPLSMGAKSKKQFEIVHFPAHMDAPSWSLRDYVVTVLDLIPLILADLYKADRPSWRFHLARWLEIRAIKNARHIIAISECTARDVNRILGIPMERISVTYLGVDQSFFAADSSNDSAVFDRLKIPQSVPYVLYVGGIDQRKNIGGLIETFKHVVTSESERGEVVPNLVLAGRIRQDRQYPKLKNLIKSAALENRVIETDYVSDDELKVLYRKAAVFFFPSLYEGFGLPPLEAMASGAPVVSSNTSSMPEVLGDAALLVDPSNANEAANAIVSILKDRTLAHRLSGAGIEQAKKFSWAKTGEATLAAYRSIANVR